MNLPLKTNKPPFFQIVPTIYESRSGAELTSYQYTFAYRNYLAYGHGGRVMPAIWFRYDLTPITGMPCTPESRPVLETKHEF